MFEDDLLENNEGEESGKDVAEEIDEFLEGGSLMDSEDGYEFDPKEYA